MARITDLGAASRETIMAAIDAQNREYWLEQDLAAGRVQQAAYASGQWRPAAWPADLREAAARLRLFPWYYFGDARRWNGQHPGFDDVEDT